MNTSTNWTRPALCSALGVAAALCSAQARAQDDDKAREFRIAASYDADTPVLAKAQERLLSLINTAANDSLKASLVPPGQVVPIEKILNAVANGSLEAAFTDPATWLDKDPAFALFSGMPLGPDVLQAVSWIKRGEGSRLMKELYAGYNVEALVCGAFVVPAGLWSRKPIEKTADLVDLKISAQGLGGAVMAGLGARVKQTPDTQVADELKNKNLDAVKLDSMSLAGQHELIAGRGSYYYPQGWGEQTAIRVLIVSRQYWAATTDAQRSVVQSACDSLTVEELSRSQASRAETVAFLKAKEINTYRWSPEVLAAMEKSWEGITAKLSDTSQSFATGWASLRKFVAGSRAFDSIIR